jgi:hypothetical protein
MKKWLDEFEGSSAAGIGAFFGFLFAIGLYSVLHYIFHN